MFKEAKSFKKKKFWYEKSREVGGGELTWKEEYMIRLEEIVCCPGQAKSF